MASIAAPGVPSPPTRSSWRARTRPISRSRSSTTSQAAGGTPHDGDDRPPAGLSVSESWYRPASCPCAPNGSPALADLAEVTIVGGLDGAVLGQDRLTVLEAGWAAPSGRRVITPSPARRAIDSTSRNLPRGSAARLGGHGATRVCARCDGRVGRDRRAQQRGRPRRHRPRLRLSSVLTSGARARGDRHVAGPHRAGGLRATARPRQPAEWRPSSRRSSSSSRRATSTEFHVTSRVVSRSRAGRQAGVDRSRRFRGVAALVCLVLGIQAHLAAAAPGGRGAPVLRSFGASPAVAVDGSLIGVLAAAVLWLAACWLRRSALVATGSTRPGSSRLPR